MSLALVCRTSAEHYSEHVHREGIEGRGEKGGEGREGEKGECMYAPGSHS